MKIIVGTLAAFLLESIRSQRGPRRGAGGTAITIAATTITAGTTVITVTAIGIARPSRKKNPLRIRRRFLGLVTHLVFSDTGIAARLSVDAVRFVAFGGGLVA
jgi:hypothetical protein